MRYVHFFFAFGEIIFELFTYVAFFFSFFKKAPTDCEFVTWADRLVFDRRAQRKWKCPPRKFTLWELCTYLLTTAVQKPRTLNSQGSLASPVRHWWTQQHFGDQLLKMIHHYYFSSKSSIFEWSPSYK